MGLTKQKEVPYLKILIWVFITLFIIFLIGIIILCKLWRKRMSRNNSEGSLKSSFVNFKTHPWKDFTFSEVKYSPVISESNRDQENFNFESKSLIMKPHEIKKKECFHLSPKLKFQLNYHLRTNELEVFLNRGKNLPNYFRQNIVVSVMLSNNSSIYYSNYVAGPEPKFEQSFCFPLDSSRISEDPPIKIKFNIWTVDRYSKKNPYGYVEVSLEEILQKNGLTPPPEKGLWKTVIQCTNLKDDTTASEAYIHTTYLSAARRFSIVLSQAKNLNINPLDKEIQGRVVFKYLGSEEKSVFTESLPAKENVNFNEEFVFHVAELKNPNVNLEDINFIIEIHSRSGKIFTKSRILGSVFIGSSSKYGKYGNEHWATMMSSTSTVSRWHQLNENEH